MKGLDKQVNYIWFDLGYTLVYVNREERYQKKLKELGVDVSLEKLTLAFHLADKYFMREHPGLLGKKWEMYATAYHQVLHTYLELDIDFRSKALIEPDDPNRPKGHWKAFEATIPTLQMLKKQGIGVGLISNWNETARNVLKETEILSYLDHIVISSEVGYEKPDERIFKIALDQANISANNCLYVGDNFYDDVIGSRKVGMPSILINPFGKKGIEEVSNVQIISNIKELLPSIEPRLQKDKAK